MHRYMLHNGAIVESSAKVTSPGQVGLLNGWGVFSTLRVKSGVLFAFERHFARMQRDARLMHVPFQVDAAELQAALLRLVQANDAEESTLRVAVVRNQGSSWESPGIERPFDVIAFTADLANWGSAVRLGVVPQGRHAASPFSGTKILSWAQNLAWYEQAHLDGYDEVILLNERDEVSECTSANVFASFSGSVFTPPLSCGCLPGITREILLSEITAPGITVTEKTLRLKDLEEADEVFITSSTRELLAVEYVKGIDIKRQGTARQKLHELFRNYLQSYTDSHRTNTRKNVDTQSAPSLVN